MFCGKGNVFGTFSRIWCQTLIAACQLEMPQTKCKLASALTCSTWRRCSWSRLVVSNFVVSKFYPVLTLTPVTKKQHELKIKLKLKIQSIKCYLDCIHVQWKQIIHDIRKAKLRWSYASFHLLAPRRQHYSEDKPDLVSFRSCSDTLSTRFQHKRNQVSKQPQRQMKWGPCKCMPYLVQNITRCLFIFRSHLTSHLKMKTGHH